MKRVSAIKTLLAVFAAVTVLGSASSAFAQDVPPPAATGGSGGGAGWMTQGAEILPMGKYAFEARFGFPSLDLGVHVPVSTVFEITPFVTFDYLAYPFWIGTFGNTLGVQLKGQVWHSGPHAISLGADVGIYMDYLGGFDMGIQIGGPEVKYSYRWDNPRIAVIAGFRMPIRVGAWPATGAIVPMLFNGGFEYNVLPNLNIHANLEFGPVICIGAGGGAIVVGDAGFQFGISYLF